MNKWPSDALGNLCNLITDGKHGDCKNEEGSGYYFISAKDVNSGRISYENARQITESDFHETHRRTDLQPGDILLTNSGTIGRLAIADENEKTSKTTFQKSVAVLKPKRERISSHFLYFSLVANTTHLINAAGGAAQKNLLLGDLRRISIPTPLLAVQNEIASILSTYDDLIENNRRRMALLEDAARQVYQEWFVRLRFPGYEHARIVDGIPESWRKEYIKNIGKVITGKTPKTNDRDNYGGDIPFIKTPDMHGNVYVVETETFLTDKGGATQSGKFIPPNTILVSCIGAKLGAVSLTSCQSQFNQQINAVIPVKEAYTFFCYFACKDLKPTLEALGGGATMPNVNKSKFENLTVILPSLFHCQSFYEFCSPIFRQIQVLALQNQKLRTARDLLLPKLMSGEISV